MELTKTIPELHLKLLELAGWKNLSTDLFSSRNGSHL